MSFHVWQLVVCVRPLIRKEYGGYGNEVLPVAGEKYHIREIGFGLDPGFPEILLVRLVEVRNFVRRYSRGEFEPAFNADRFRPVVERKTDISVFTEMLKRWEVPA